MKLLKQAYIKLAKWAKVAGKTFISYADSLARARAAAELSRAGYHKEAKELLLKD
jgi:hypothetical protein